MRIGIVGAGAIGLSFAAALAGVHDVLVLAHRKPVADALARDGVGLVGDTETEFVPVRATLDAAAFADRDAILVTVKAYATGAALAPLRGVLPRHALIATLANGLENDAAARAVLPDARVIAGSTMHAAISLGPGRVRPTAAGTTTFARDDAAAPTSAELAAAFAAAGLTAAVADDIRPILWRKLVVNAAINPLAALARCANGAIATDPELAPIARVLAAEAAATAAAEGIRIDDPWALVEAAARATTANRNSMLQDLDAGRPTENDALGGAILRRANAAGVAVPMTETFVRLVRARERTP